MTFEFNQESFWNATPLFQGDGDIASLVHGNFYQGEPLRLAIDTDSQYGATLFNDGDGSPNQSWAPSQQSSREEVSPGTGRQDVSSTLSRNGPQVVPPPRRPSAEAVARRRKQNRVSQAAWRARNKELVEELRQEINEYSDYSHSMRQTMESLLETTESLKEIIVHALASGPPQASRSMVGEEQLMSPGSSHGGPLLEYERARTQSLA